MDKLDFTIIGLTFNLVGIYFVAIGVFFKKPKRILEELLGIQTGSLRNIKDYVNKRNQVVIGLIFLLLGYCLQIYGSLPQNHGKSGLFSRWTIFTVVFLLVASIVVMSIILSVIKIIWTQRAFKKLLIDSIRGNQWAFEENIRLTKELGELLGIEKKHDSSIEEYVQRIRENLKLEREVRKPSYLKSF